MARIRTIKPGFFRDYDLYEAERETGLPLRVAFAGLWTCCDREGRFEWKPRELKLDCLPHDEVDFSRVLDALATRGFLVRYASQGVEYGCVPTFLEHQVVNVRESASVLPPPPDPTDITEELTRAPRVPHACPTQHDLARVEGKGREQERKGSKSAYALSVREPPDDDRFEEFWGLYPKREGTNSRKTAALSYARAIRRTGGSDAIMDGIRAFAARCRERGVTGTRFVPQATTWLNQDGWNDEDNHRIGTTDPDRGNSRPTRADGWAMVDATIDELERRENAAREIGGKDDVGELPGLPTGR